MREVAASLLSLDNMPGLQPRLLLLLLACRSMACTGTHERALPRLQIDPNVDGDGIPRASSVPFAQRPLCTHIVLAGPICKKARQRPQGGACAMRCAARTPLTRATCVNHRWLPPPPARTSTAAASVARSAGTALSDLRLADVRRARAAGSAPLACVLPNATTRRPPSRRRIDDPPAVRGQSARPPRSRPQPVPSKHSPPKCILRGSSGACAMRCAAR